MDTTQLIFFVAFGFFSLYTLAMLILFGILPSLSDSYYALKRKYHTGMLFQIMLGTVAASMLIVLLNLTEGYWFQWLAFFTAGPLLFTAAAPEFKSVGPVKSLESGVHGKSALISAIASLVLTICIALYITPAAWISLMLGFNTGVIGYRVNRFKNKIYWAEYACFVYLFNVTYLLV